jgi:hypothetical protein
MGKDTFLLLFVLGAGALATWVAMRLPRLAPPSMGWAWGHLVAAMVVGGLLGPVLHAVPGLPSAVSLYAALFGIALPALTYMLLAGMWLVQLAVGERLAPRR